MGRRKQKKKAKREAKGIERAKLREEAPGESARAEYPAEEGPTVEAPARAIEIELEIAELASGAEPGSSSEDHQRLSSAEPSHESDDKTPAAPAQRPPEASDHEEGSAEPTKPTKSESPSAKAAPAAADRRTHARYAFKAIAEVIATDSGARTSARVLDLSQQGCYLDTKTPQPLKTTVEVRITQSGRSMKAQGRVVYSQPGKGMGLMFTSVDHAHNQVLYAWIAESRETSWLAANRRRSQRVVMRLPVRLSAEAGAGFFDEEETYTLTVSAHGALVASAAPLYRGQRVTLSNVQTKGSLECLVAHIDKSPGEQTKIGLEFLLPNPMFWHVAFPPKDWTPRHPDAKAR